MEDRLLQSPTRVKHLVVGSTLVAAGLILFGAGLSIWHIFRLWPLIIVAGGVTGVASACCAPRRRSALMTTTIGVWLLLVETTTLRYSNSWPFLLIAVGGLIAWGALVPTRPCAACGGKHHDH